MPERIRVLKVKILKIQKILEMLKTPKLSTGNTEKTGISKKIECNQQGYENCKN